MLPKEAIEDFKVIWEKEFGEKLNDSEVLEHALPLFNIVRMLIDSSHKELLRKVTKDDTSGAEAAVTYDEETGLTYLMLPDTKLPFFAKQPDGTWKAFEPHGDAWLKFPKLDVSGDELVKMIQEALQTIQLPSKK